MLNTPKSVPIEELLSRPVVMELEDLGDDETKSFVIGILLVQLYEYRKSQMTKGSKQLSHILMVEEAHRLLKNVSESGEGGNTRAKSVEFFCNLLAEIRTFGQGILIADQIPTKLAPDTIKNTNLKIVHRTVALEDRETIGRAMNMSPEQIEYLSSLRRGYAAVYAEGDNRPKCVKLPLVKSYYEKNRGEVIAEVKKKVYDIASGYDEVICHHAGCSYCEHRCKYHKKISEYIDTNVATNKVLEKWVVKKFAPKSFDAFLNSELIKKLNIQRALKEGIKRNDEKTSLFFALICRRADRKSAALKWTQRYLANQDEENLDRKTVIILDAFASGLLGSDSEGVVSRQMGEWLEHLADKPGFVEQQTKQWSDAINLKRKPLATNDYTYLRKYSKTWPALQDIMEGAMLHAEILGYFTAIFEQESSTDSLKAQLDEILNTLVSEFDEEEIPLRKEEKYNQFVIDFDGDEDRARQNMAVEQTAFEEHKDFTQLLTDAAMKPDSSHASASTQKFAIALSKEWVSNSGLGYIGKRIRRRCYSFD